MPRTGKALCLPVLLASALALATGGTAPAQMGDSVLPRIFADWKKRQERMRRVRYRLEGEFVLAKGMAIDSTGKPKGPDFPPKDLIDPFEYLILLDFQTNRHRLERTEQRRDEDYLPLRTRSVSVFTGSELRGTDSWEPSPGSKFKVSPDRADVNITAGRFQDLFSFPIFFRPLFYGHGIITAGLTGRNTAGQFKPDLDMEEFYVHGRAIHDRRSCVVLRTQARSGPGVNGWFWELWIDVERESAVVRCAFGTSQHNPDLFDIQYRKTSSGWMPASWTYTLRVSGLTQHYERTRVVEMVVDPPVTDADFQIDIRPGMRIHKRTVQGPMQKNRVEEDSQDFRVDPEGKWIELVNGVEKPPRQYGRLVAAAVLSVGVVLAALLLWRRFRRKARARPTPG